MNLNSGARRVMSTRSPASACSAKSVSSPATPPPAMTTRAAEPFARLGRARAWPLVSAIAEQLRKHDSVVVLAIARGVDDRHRAVSRTAPQLLEAGGLVVELVAVTGAKAVESLGNVIEPATQPVARCQLACPVVQLGARA